MTPDEISLREHFNERFDDLEAAMDLKIAAALGRYVKWSDLGLAISAASTLVGLAFLLTGNKP